ncbi:iron complex outermembrane recepter protein [Flexibacter flexilis DSM 6793]|uniref:Iron complex outermembrane recepter protein n=1 Tax=Flexibacter flexilis DSM 6793 TaxID=927664 RepID=A0A1I1N237_9BACT|nr:TonB-dependent receptor [Flexibacter flexilis]SFC91406.1 iron complex outermembrane recepter protein [Flexibacter flexilis DSM 6793]
MKSKFILSVVLMLLCQMVMAQSKISGIVKDDLGAPLNAVTVFLEGTPYNTSTDAEGNFTFTNIADGNYTLQVSLVGYKAQKQEIKLPSQANQTFAFAMPIAVSTLGEVEVFGDRNKRPEKLDAITRLPLKPSEQIQSVSVISNKLIEEQGSMTITEATQNVVGVTLFGSYGNVRESMSTRGYRGTPVLKNGVRMDSDFRTGSAVADMQGVESIQVLKGSASITQGIGNSLGSAGGVINVATKTPKFVNKGEVGLRVGSWGQFRPTFDIQNVLDKAGTVAFRINGAYERADSYRPTVTKNRVYINPSFEWRPNERTSFTFELDHLHDATTPDRGTVNLADDSVNALYEMPRDKFLGFGSDKYIQDNTTITARLTRNITDKLDLRVAYFASTWDVDNTGIASLTTIGKQPYNIRKRSITRSTSSDENSTLQLDLIGKEFNTGKIKHTFQTGIDYTTFDKSTVSYNSLVVDTINVFEKISNTLPSTTSLSSLTAGAPTTSKQQSYGMMAQEILTVNKYLRFIMGLRYSYYEANTGTSSAVTTGDAWNPLAGVMISPTENINLFGSYTNTTDLRSASNPMIGGGTIGESVTRQWEFGVKSDWLNNRLRFNFTYFDILNSNLSYSEYNAAGNATGFYGKAGDLARKGIETELTGRVLENFQVILGYAYLDAQYNSSPAYVEGSAPSNAPTHTANAWAYYTFDKGFAKGLSFGAGAYYVGERPTNEFTQKVIIHNTQPGVKPFNMEAYTTVNAQLGYSIKNLTARVFFNNIFDVLGYNSYYRGGFINQINPRNVAVNLAYKF